MIDLNNKNILVTGPDSMIGKSVIQSLLKRKANVITASHSQCDLMDIENIRHSFGNFDIDYGILLATYSGNIQFNTTFPAETYLRSSQINLNSLRFCQEKKVKKVVSVLSSCAYADNGKDMLVEDEFWNGLPNESIESHGLAKRHLAEFSRQLYKQYKMLCISVVVNNSYGPYDNFLISKTKVIGGLIKRFTVAKQEKLDSVECWGTGQPRRSFVYCDDAAEGILQSLESYNDPMVPLNISSDTDISIKDLSELIAKLVGYKGKILFDGRADGQMKKSLCTHRMKKYLNWEPTILLEKGLKQTISWYTESIGSVS